MLRRQRAQATPRARHRLPGPRQQAAVYPERDGKPLAETPFHRREIMRLIETLQVRYADDPKALVEGDMFIYIEKGNPRRHLSPDVFVALGVPKEPDRNVFLLWEEAPPAFVIEVTSSSTWAADQKKRERYRAIGVREYVLYDPQGRWLQPPLQGWLLSATGAAPMTVDAGGGLLSDALGLRLVLEDGRLQLYDRQTGQRLRTPREAAEARAETERAARHDAEARANALAARLAELEARLGGRDREESP